MWVNWNEHEKERYVWIDREQEKERERTKLFHEMQAPISRHTPNSSVILSTFQHKRRENRNLIKTQYGAYNYTDFSAFKGQGYALQTVGI